MQRRAAQGRPTSPSAFPVALDGRVVLAAFCWALSPGFFVAEAIAQSAWTTPYSMIDNYISDLGAAHCGTVTINAYEAYVCSPLHPLMNAAYIAVGALAVIGAFAGRRAWPKGGLSTTGLVLVALAGAGAVVAGIFPEDVNQDLHIVGALLAVPMSNLGMLLLAVAVRRHNRWLAAYSTGGRAGGTGGEDNGLFKINQGGCCPCPVVTTPNCPARIPAEKQSMRWTRCGRW